jgi:hypothetical protein
VGWPGRWWACSRVCAYESASSHIRAGGGRPVALGTADAARRARCGTGRPGRVCAGAWRTGPGRPRSGGAPRIRAYGALARDAKPARRPSSEAGGLPAARPWPCAGAPPGCSKPDHQFRRVNGHLHLPNSAPLGQLKTNSRMSVPRARMRTSKRHDDHRAATEILRGLGTTSVLVSGHGGRRVVYQVLPGLLAASAGREERTAHVDA